MKLPIWLAIPLFILIIIFSLLSGEGEDIPPISDPSFQVEDELEVALLTSDNLDVEVPVASGAGKTWLVMLYQDADDKILEKDIYIDLNEAERVGSTDRVHIVAQVDRFQAGFSGDGDWASTRRYYITRDEDLNRVGSKLAQELGEANMADGQTLVDFVTWAVSNYPADNYVLILSDHGMGWPGGWSDPSPGGRDPHSAPLASKLGEHLFLSEIDQALGEIRHQTGIDKFEIIGFDACLMAQLEVFTALEPHARFAIASEETEPALGWAYTGFLTALTSNPDMSGKELSQAVIDSYIQEDQRIVDPVAREEFASQGSPLSALFGFGRATSEQLTQQLGRDVTLSAVDLGLLPELMARFNDFSYALQNDNQAKIAAARTYARSYTSIFGREVPPSFIDLGHFLQLVEQESQNNTVKKAAREVLAALGKAVVAERHGEGKKGSSGMSIYFPNSTLYSSPMAGPQSYTTIAERFADQSLWDDFLAFHYHDRTFDQNVRAPYIPTEGTRLSVPGQGTLSISPIKVSSDVASPGNPVDLSVEISGQNISYIKLFVGFYDQGSNSIFYVDTDYLESPETREINGVYYPKWSDEGKFTLEFTWDPYIFAITDGEKLVPSLFQPEIYGASAEDAVYTVDGTYSFAEGGDTRYARLYFRDGILRQVFGFTGQVETGAPREIIPQTGDQFTVIDQWMDMDPSGKVTGMVPIEGETLTFGDDMFRWEEIYAAVGMYVVGFIVEDLDGNASPVYAQIRVE
ncbi:MAG: clostripain-related cysteine peptidase [Anaerolineales bacterium]|nr:clostripain-related cysteine peptidase [Anaerolineales bacterium]